MAVTGITMQPRVVYVGGARVERYAYTDDETFIAGDPIRITTSGTIQLAEGASAGAVHGMALSDSSGSGDVAPVLLFDDDTIIALQCVDGVKPDDLTKGVAYTLEVTSGATGVTSTTTNGIVVVTDTPKTRIPWTDATGTYDYETDKENGIVYVRVLRSVLDGHAAKSS